MEDKILITKAREKIENTIIQWFCDDDVMFGVYCMVDKVADPKQKTLGISTQSNPPCIKFNPLFVNSISKEKLECVLVQEGFKLLLRHPTTRLSTPKNISSLSSNVTVTPLSLGGLMNSEELKEFFPTPKMFDLPEGKYYEDYFRRLMDRQEDTNEKIKKIWDSLSKEEKKEIIEKAMEQSSNGSGKPDDNKDGESDGNKDGESDGKSGGGFQEFKNEKEAMKEHYNPNGTNNDEWGSNDMFDSEIQDMVNEKKGSFRNWGKYTGNALDSIVAANTPKISWKEILRSMYRSAISRKTIPSRMKMNRRYGFRMPGDRRLYDTKLLFAVDTSGSMSNEDIAEGISVMNSTCKHAKITYMMFDTEVKHTEKDFKRAKKNFKAYGRGGTDFQCVVDYANESDVDGVVIFTDGFASEPKRLKGKTKMLWLLANKDQKPPCSWGRVAHLKRYDDTH
jgi:hypothetical protein